MDTVLCVISIKAIDNQTNRGFMNIQINNQQTATSASTLSELATELALPQKGVAIAVANKMVPREAWETTALEEGASVVIIKAAFGG